MPFLVVFVVLVSTGGNAAAAGGADLALTAAAVGTGAPKARVGETATYTITVTNLGPDASTGTYLIPLLPDAFNLVSMTCSDATFCDAPGGSLAAGSTVTATLVAVVCCFPARQSRTTEVGATVVSDNDPNLQNNVASVRTKIVGPHGFAFP
jgi:uncharacterized repeat protein (TIGR01451 family)